MPCFKGLAVSIHTPSGPLPEHHIQKQSRTSRINAYIPVPPPKVSSSTRKPEPSTFAISITLLTPGLSVPYSTPKATPEDPYPRPAIVGGAAGFGRERSTNAISPYESLTSSHNETIAAYIYFDGRHKEEVATLLRRGEETWVNSRWVSVPQSEGGGLAEREFLFREVGLERWLNGLDLEGKDAAATIEKRRRKIEKKRLKKENSDDSDNDGPARWRRRNKGKSVLRYGENALEKVSDDESADSSSDSSDDDPMPEAAGQIKVALFRVLASGEIKKGEYEPQFGADEDDEDNKNGEDGDIDHTTSFAKPKSLDPKSISTQTVTGIDPSDRPYATFTFYYRGEKTLRKMGILKQKAAEAAQLEVKPGASKRTSVQADIAKLKPLKPGGTLGFSGIRDGRASDKRGKDDDDEMESEDDDTSAVDKIEDGEEDVKSAMLSPEDARKQGEIADGVERIRLKRQHSVEPSANIKSSAQAPSKSPKIEENLELEIDSPFLTNETYKGNSSAPDDSMIGSPLKKPRSDTMNMEHELHRATVENLAKGLGFGYSGPVSKSDSNAPAEMSFGGPLQAPVKPESGSNSHLPATQPSEVEQEAKS